MGEDQDESHASVVGLKHGGIRVLGHVVGAVEQSQLDVKLVDVFGFSRRGCQPGWEQRGLREGVSC